MVPRGVLGRASVAFLAALAVSAAAAPAAAQSRPQAQPQRQPEPAQIDRNGVLILVRGSLLALHAANETGNYTVLRDLGAPGFQQINTAARLGEIFASLRAQKLDLSGVAALDPQLTLLPQIEADGSMRLAGVFPSVPLQINFELLYAPVNGQWRLNGISVGLANSGPAAPQPPALDKSEPQKPPEAAAKPAPKKPETPKPQAPRPAPDAAPKP